jgi:hypothetical protein
MKTVTESKLDLSPKNLWKSKNVRSDLRLQIERTWLKPDGSSANSSNIGHQYLKLQDGLLMLGGYFERTDILLFQVQNTCNVFMGTSGYPDIQVFSGVTLDKEEEEKIRLAAIQWYLDEKEYVEHEARFLMSQPWKEVVGMSVADGCKKLKEMGW